MPRKAIDISGRRFGKLLIVKRAGSIDSHAAWHAVCDCGRKIVAISSGLLRGTHNSCGCLVGETNRRLRMTHGQTSGGHSRTFRIWNAMKQRCHNPNQPHYVRYGGAGVTVCDRWRNSFADFYADMGDPPTIRHSIDRIDNDRGYEPGNCRWATASEQERNKRKYSA